MSCSLQEKERKGVINPIFTCQPAGAQFVGIGIKDCIPLVHGGQGCCMFVRLMFAQHFNENFDIASSSVNEGAAVFGGIAQAEEAVITMIGRYPHLRILPIITTCSTETIGDDVDGLVTKLEKRIKKDFPDREVILVPVHTPSYTGSQIHGYDNALKAIVEKVAKKGKTTNKINVFTGWVNPGDVTEVKHIFEEMQIEGNFVMDTESFDAPTMPDKSSFAHGSTTVEDLEDTANAKATVALCKYEGGKAAEYLQTKFKVPAIIEDMPIGIKNTDKFLMNLTKLTDRKVSQALAIERGKALDTIADLAHMFFADKKVAIYGDPDLVLGLAEFCLECELKPVLLLLGDDNKAYSKDPRITELQNKVDFDMEIIMNSDLWELEKRIKNKEMDIDLILGHSKGRFIAIDNEIPMVRVGFPTFDRAGLWRHPVIGYNGAIYLAETIANALFTDMEYKHNKEWLLNVW